MRVVGQCNIQQTCHVTCVHIWEVAVEPEEVGQDHVNRPEFQLARNGM